MRSSVKATVLAELMPLIRERLAAGQSVSFSPKGTSMLPMLRQGVDTVELSGIQGGLKKYDIPLYQRENGQFVLHRIVKTGKSFTCMGDNQFQPEYPVEPEQMIAVVTAFTRNGRRIEVTNPGYRFYCRFWCFTRPVRHLLRRCWRGVKRLLKQLIS
jgi:hypothetical protein